MERRSFLKGILLAGMAPAIVKAGSLMRINPEILIVPNGIEVRPVLDIAKIDAKIASIGCNRLLTMPEITNAALRILENELSFSNQLNRQYDEKFALKTLNDMVCIRKPMRFMA